MNKTLKSLLAIAVVYLLISFGKQWYMTPKFDSGEQIPAFTATLKNGEEFSLSDLQGNMVLLDFWGSWCGPCRAKNPDLVNIYDQYHGKKFKDFKDFEIVSVGIDKKEAAWKKAIDRDNLHWNHHILDVATNLKFFNGVVAKEFGVKEVPSNYLLNAKGEIVGVNLKMHELEERLRNSAF
jgi:thiol-disulfide isomerase/thioredoxin